MKLSYNLETSNPVLTEVYNPLEFKTNAGEELTICMRDSGFEIFYGDKHYEAKNGVIKLIDK